MGNIFSEELAAEKADAIPDLAVVPMIDLTTDPYCCNVEAHEVIQPHKPVPTEKKLARARSPKQANKKQSRTVVSQTEVRRCKSCHTGIPDRKTHQEYCGDCYQKTMLPTMRACAVCKRRTIKSDSSFLVCYNCTRAK